MTPKPDLIVVITDTLRIDYLGCYGNGQIRTPNIDAFAKESTTFTGAYPESLPTIVFRRAFHTGRRTFPFRNYRPVKWDIVYLPGWQPMDNDEDTLAENLAAKGYYTGFVTDTLPYFAPGMNFTRGFWQWEFVRGKQQDRWRSPSIAPRERLARYGDPDALLKSGPNNLITRHVANTAHELSEEDTPTARTFRWAMDFLEHNRNTQPIYLLADSFAPHEPWEAPASYHQMYADPNYHGRTVLHTRYGPMDGQLTEDELRNIVAHYSGLVSLVDTWFGRLIGTIKRLGLYDNSVIVFVSDHGTNFADNPRRVVGKPANAMYPGVVHLPLLIRFPNGAGAGQRFDQLLYNVDVVATLYDLSRVRAEMGHTLRIHGRSLLPLVTEGKWPERPYLTCRYGNELWYRDQRLCVLFDLDGNPRESFDLVRDPRCQVDITAQVGDGIRLAWQRVLEDASGDLPDYRAKSSTDAIGQRTR